MSESDFVPTYSDDNPGAMPSRKPGPGPGRPRVPAQFKKERVSLCLSRQEIEFIRKQAKLKNVSTSRIVREAVEDQMAIVRRAEKFAKRSHV
jgi:hypothetical protein